MLDIILFGMQGSGKGTQAQRLLETYPNAYSYFASGDVFRALTSSPNAIGDYLKGRLAQGQLISDGVTNALFETYFYTLIDEQKYMLLDGYPRSMLQMQSMVELMQHHERPVLGIHLVLSKDVAIERMKGRGRSDDTEESIIRRLAQFEEITMPMITYFKNHMTMIEINAAPHIDEVAASVQRAMKKYKNI